MIASLWRQQMKQKMLRIECDTLELLNCDTLLPHRRYWLVLEMIVLETQFDWTDGEKLPVVPCQLCWQSPTRQAKRTSAWRPQWHERWYVERSLQWQVELLQGTHGKQCLRACRQQIVNMFSN